MKIDLKSPEAQFALELVRSGSELARRVRAETSVKSRIKKDCSPVTLADMGIQAIAGALLEQYFPQAVLVAEEDADYLKIPQGAEDLKRITGYVRTFFPEATPEKICRWIDKGRGEPAGLFWTLDPIDGTKGFLRGGQYAIALAFIKKGKVEMAALGCPELELQDHKSLGKGVGIFAVRGQGCWAASLSTFESEPRHGRAAPLDDLKQSQQWVRLEVSKCRDIHHARVLDSFDPEHKNVEKNRCICEALGTRLDPVSMDSLAKHAVIASGGAEIFFRTLPRKEPEHREKIWDVAAGALAIKEAGGRVTDLEGRELDFGVGHTLAKNPGLVATNGFLHETVLEALRKAAQA